MNLTDATKLFGWFPDKPLSEITQEDVAKRFKELAFDAHPDHGNSGASIEELRAAREVLKQHAQLLEGMVKCSKCNGTGQYLTRSSGRISCPSCAGVGFVKPRSFSRG